MQIQSASIPSSIASNNTASPTKQSPAQTAVSQPSAVSPDKPDARSYTQDETETSNNTSFSPVSAPIPSTSSNASLGTNRDVATSNRPINQYQQMASQLSASDGNAESDLFGIDVYV